MSKAAKPQEPDSNIDELEQELIDLTEALQRERADSTNLRRQHEEQIAGLKEHIKADIIRHLSDHSSMYLKTLRVMIIFQV
jgi:molecular chaperone GrpE (heat shock protein)